MEAEVVYIAYDLDWERCRTIGAYSTLDSALNSCYDFIDHHYPETIWIWDAENYRLEREGADNDILIIKTVVDVNDWEIKYEH